VLESAAPILANFFKEMKMSKLRVRGTLVALVLFTAVAVFPSVVQALTSKKATHRATADKFSGTGALMADGGDPWPIPNPPNPIPWSSAVA